MNRLHIIVALAVAGCANSQEPLTQAGSICDILQELAGCRSGVAQFGSENARTVIEDRVRLLSDNENAEVLVNVVSTSELQQSDVSYKLVFPQAEQSLLGANVGNSKRYWLARRLGQAALRAGDFGAASRLLLFRRKLVDSRDLDEQWTHGSYDAFSVYTAEGLLQEIAQDYADLGDLETAIETLESTQASGTTSPVKSRLDYADLRLRAHDFAGAIQDAEAALAKARRNKQSRTDAAIVLLAASLGAGQDGRKEREQVRSAVLSEKSYLSGHGRNFIKAAFLLKETDPVFASELFEDARRIEEIILRDFSDLLPRLSFSCRWFGSQSCLSDLAERAEDELSDNDDFLFDNVGRAYFDNVGKAYAALGDYESAIRWASMRTSSVPAMPIFDAIVRDAVERGDEVAATAWLQKWAEDQTPFSPWSIHQWGAPEDKYAYMAAGYALLSKLHLAEGRRDAAKQSAISAFMLALEGSAWRPRSNESVTGGLGNSLGFALGALAAAER